jgi:hypothetical protein
MSTALTDALFAAAATAIVVAQLFILRSTRRGMALGGRRGAPVLEWLYAIVPALALLAVLAWTWRTMHPAGGRADAAPRIARTPS